MKKEYAYRLVFQADDEEINPVDIAAAMDPYIKPFLAQIMGGRHYQLLLSGVGTASYVPALEPRAGLDLEELAHRVHGHHLDHGSNRHAFCPICLREELDHAD